MRKIAADYQQTQGTLPDIGYAVFSGFLVVMVIVATLLCAAIGFVISAFGLVCTRPIVGGRTTVRGGFAVRIHARLFLRLAGVRASTT